jgi:imidazolonepropionase
MTDLTAVVRGAAEVVVGPGGGADGLDRREDAAVAVVDGRVAAVGPTEELVREYPPENATRDVDVHGRSVIPGFVDSHTHGLFAGDRADEFEARLAGATYQEILAEGGGILRTVRATREASEADLLGRLLSHLDTMLAHGTTTAEVKSGYGLDAETELRMLEVLARADEAHPVDVVPTFMGAHAVPEGRDADDYVAEVVGEQLPAVADQGIAEFCDVFCEEGVFSVEQSRRVLEAGVDAGLAPKVHAEEFSRLGGADLAAEMGAVSADHLLHATEGDVEALVDAGVTPVLLPGTAFSLGADYPDARAYIDAARRASEDDPPASNASGGESPAGATGSGRSERRSTADRSTGDGRSHPIAVATDFNPNCYSQSVGFAITLACVGAGMTPAEALTAATRNGARALGRGESNLGTLRTGAPADLLVLDAPSYVHVPYNFAVDTVGAVLKRGEVVYDDGVILNE